MSNFKNENKRLGGLGGFLVEFIFYFLVPLGLFINFFKIHESLSKNKLVFNFNSSVVPEIGRRVWFFFLGLFFFVQGAFYLNQIIKFAHKFYSGDSNAIAWTIIFTVIFIIFPVSFSGFISIAGAFLPKKFFQKTYDEKIKILYKIFKIIYSIFIPASVAGFYFYLSSGVREMVVYFSIFMSAFIFVGFIGYKYTNRKREYIRVDI